VLGSRKVIELSKLVLARTGQHSGMARRIWKGAVCCWREDCGSDGFRVTCLFYFSFPASFSSSLLELVWRVSFYPFCLGLYLPWAKAITVDPTIRSNSFILERLDSSQWSRFVSIVFLSFSGSFLSAQTNSLYGPV